MDGSPILPTVWPLAWITCFLFWCLMASVQGNQTCSPPEPLLVQECRGRLQLPQAPCKHVDPSSAPPGLPPLVFVDQSSGGRPPTVVLSPNASGRVQSNSYLFIFRRRRPEKCGSTPHPGQRASLFAPPAIPSRCLCAPSHGS